MANLIGNEVASIRLPRTQVYMATHDGGDNRLPYRYRSFISFSFGGQWIEDFNLIATVDGDRMSRNLTGEFEDLTSTYDVLDGQFYHSTHFQTNTISFTLSTDGMDSRMMEKFINWFAPGQTRELILSEHPNRGIMARVSTPPEINMLPFEKEVIMNIGGIEYKTSVTNFKGDISLELVMDDPFWYSIINIFGQVITINNGTQISYVNEWDGVAFLESTPAAKDKLKDVLKIVYEDGIPMYSMIASPMLFGNNVYATSGGRYTSVVAGPANSEEFTSKGWIWDANSEGCFTIDDVQWFGARAEENDSNNYSNLATIDGAFVTTTANTSLTVPPGEENAVKLYYAGTAPAPIKLSFNISITFDSNGYIDCIANNYHKQDDKPYNSIIFKSVHEHELRLTTPNILTSYNMALKIIENSAGKSFEALRDQIRDEVRHPLIRGSVITIINGVYELLENPLALDAENNAIAKIISEMPGIIGSTLHVEFNSKTGEAIGQITCVNIKSYLIQPGFVLGERTNVIFWEIENKTLRENVGDMLNSNYLLLIDRNSFDTNMLLQARTEQHKDYSYIVYHNFPVSLQKFSIEYKNLYY